MKTQSNQNLFWTRVVRFFGDDAELAMMGLLTAIFAAAVSVVLLFRWLEAGRDVLASGLVLIVGTGAIVCVRDYRRGRWSIFSSVAAAAWLLLTVAATGYAYWESLGK